jgi:hypothetical protein
LAFGALETRVGSSVCVESDLLVDITKVCFRLLIINENELQSKCCQEVCRKEGNICKKFGGKLMWNWSQTVSNQVTIRIGDCKSIATFVTESSIHWQRCVQNFFVEYTRFTLNKVHTG